MRMHTFTYVTRLGHEALPALQDISARYGHPVVVLNLVKSAEKRPRETILRKEFAIAIAYINQQVCHHLMLMYICSTLATDSLQ